MKKILFIFAIVVLFANHAFADASDDDDDDDYEEDESSTQLTRRNDVDVGSVDEYDIDDRKTPIQKSEQWRNLSPEDRRRMAVDFYYAVLGLCEKKSIKHCAPSDAKFIAKEYAKGDPDCLFFCGYDKMIENRDSLPGTYTLALAIDIGYEWDKEVSQVSDMESLVNRATGAGKKAKRIIIFPVVFAAISAIINIGSMAAIGYFSNDANLDDMARVGGKSGQIRAALNPALKVVKTSRGCFDVKGTVVIKDKSGYMFTKKLADLKVGDNVKSVDDNGNIVFTQVYFIAHDDSSQIGKLLRVHYEGNNGELGHIGLSDRHLIYATKSDSHYQTADKAKPIMASELAKGDLLWVNSEGGLVARKVSEVVPYFGHVIHPLTDNHHIIVNGVHASVHILEESAYRMLTAPLKFVCWLSPEAGKSGVVKKLVRFVEDAKEPFANKHIGSILSGREIHMGVYGVSEA